ncbi:MAG: acyltransferase [Planctomycetaceae bacterium]|nr:acyltransferase [Planctomycetaceae bacterium]
MADDPQRQLDAANAPRVAPVADRSSPAVGQPPARFAFLDGLRGLAALGIAVYHIWRYEPPQHPEMKVYPAMECLPWIVDWVLLRSWVGVQFLLVLSGFVIAFTLRETWVTPREMVSFLGRRIVRLGPPYWVTLAFVLVLHVVNVTWWNLPPAFEEPLTSGRVLAHIAFLQDVLGQTPLSAAIWTVCIEMQFYVVCVLGWGLAQRLRRRSDRQSPRPSATALMLVFAPLALVSLVYWNRLDSTEPWVIHFLCSFFLGMVTWWTLDRTVSPLVFVASIAVVAGHLAFQWKLENALALTAALSIFVAGRTGHFHDWLNWRWLQYLGRISYSLYLIHYPVSHCLTWVGWRWCDNSPTPVQSSLILLACLVASIAAGHLLYVSVEVPAGRWSAWLKARRPAG